MYSKTLHVSLFGISDALAAALERITPLDRFSHELSPHTNWDDAAFVASDIALVDAALLPGSDLPSLVAQRRERLGASFGAFVVIADIAALAAWTADDYALADAVWPAPLDETRLAFEFARLQREARLSSELHLARTYLEAAIDSSPELIWFKDIDGTHVKVNKAFCTTVQKPREQVEGRDHCYIWDVPPEEAEGAYACQESEEQAMRAGCTCQFNELVKTAHGMRQFRTYKTPLYDEDGRIMGTAGIGHDVTDLQNVATELDILINALPFSVVIEDADGTILNANRETETHFKMDKQLIIGHHIKDWRRLVFGDELADLREVHEDREFDACIGGQTRLFEMTKTPIVDVFDNETGLLRIYSDVTEKRELEERATMNARTDYLTGLYNRRYFYEYLDERGRNESLALVVLDLDDFKDVNDRYGHAVGDEVLMKAGVLLREAFPEGLAIRWGGDEFIVAVFGQHDMPRLEAQAEALLDRFHAESNEDGHAHALTGSVGIVSTDDPSLSIDELIRRGDEALYHAKRAGKSQCYVYQEDEPLS